MTTECLESSEKSPISSLAVKFTLMLMSEYSWKKDLCRLINQSKMSWESFCLPCSHACDLMFESAAKLIVRQYFNPTISEFNHVVKMNYDFRRVSLGFPQKKFQNRSWEQKIPLIIFILSIMSDGRIFIVVEKSHLVRGGSSDDILKFGQTFW